MRVHFIIFAFEKKRTIKRAGLTGEGLRLTYENSTSEP